MQTLVGKSKLKSVNRRRNFEGILLTASVNTRRAQTDELLRLEAVKNRCKPSLINRTDSDVQLIESDRTQSRKLCTYQCKPRGGGERGQGVGI